jgi:prevent-host-death family protein
LKIVNDITTEQLWTVKEAKSKLSEILRRARESGPQWIGSRNQCVVVSRQEWEKQNAPSESLGTWLTKNSPGVAFDVPERGESEGREIPFTS